MGAQNARIIGIDPGSRICGWGVIDFFGNQIKAVDHGTFQPSPKLDFSKRLHYIYTELEKVIQIVRPQILVLEKAFFSKNASSALKLGQVRGVVMLCGEENKLEFFEYSPNEIKRAISGHGHSDKEGMAKMVQLIVGEREFRTHDESDALSVAICHALSDGSGSSIPKSKHRRMSDIVR